MLDKIRDAARKHGLLARNSRALVAVSGGADSVALVTALRELAPELGVELLICHLNHRIRGKAAQEDAAFVKQLASRLRLGCVTISRDVPRVAKRAGISIEMAARAVRYRVFEQVAKKHGCDTLVTGHTADDQAETFIIKLARGAGAAGLSGIQPKSVRGVLRVERPMLDVTHAEAESFLKSRGVSWREDSTNADTDILRNSVRHEVIPFLEKKLNPGIGLAIKRAADILSEENKWLDELALAALKKCSVKEDVRPGKGCVRDSVFFLDAVALSKYPRACVRRVVLKWLFDSGVPAHKVSFELVEEICDMLCSGSGRRAVNLHAGHRVVLESGILKIERRVSRESCGFSVKIKPPCETVVKSAGLRIELSKSVGFEKTRPGMPGELPASAAVSLRKVGRRQLTVRSWRPGDRMRPFGMKGCKKLKDIFIDAKVPPEERCRIPVFVCGSEIIWIPGYRIAAGWELSAQSEKALVMRVEAVST